MINCFVRCKNFQEVNSAWKWITEREETSGWPKSLSRKLVDRLDKVNEVFIWVGEDGTVSGGDIKPKGFDELVLTYQNVLTVVRADIKRNTIEFQGKRYYVDELEEALRGCEVK